MIAKILPQAKSFSAVRYNEKKVDKNLGYLVEAYNFGYLNVLEQKTEKDYLRYFELWSDKNKNIKNKQFHVSISCKGREYSQKELTEIGKKWMSKMGYDGLPTMIYFHTDTSNNHIHIISTRVGKSGKKINDSHEKYRARESILSIMNVDYKNSVRKDFIDALKYEFNGVRQFEMIMNSRGYSTKIEGENIVCSKEGKPLLCKSKKIIEWVSDRGKEKNIETNKKRNRQIYAIFKKYRSRMNLDDFQKLMRQRFGISIVFFQKENKPPYGYAVIDHTSQRVIKGSDIYKLKEMLKEPNKIEQIEGMLLNILNRKEISRETIQLELRKWGVVLENNKVVNKRTKEIVFELDESIMDKINNGIKINRVKRYNIKSDKDKELLANFFGINKSTINVNTVLINKDDKVYYSNILEHSKFDRNILYSEGIFIKKDNDDFYLIDTKKMKIYSFTELGYSYEEDMALNLSEMNKVGEYDLIDALDLYIDTYNGQNEFGGADNRLKKKVKK